MQSFLVPARADVSAPNQAIFDNLNKALGFVPNLYATIAYSDTALGNYLQLQQAPTSLSKKEREAVNLVVSQENGCRYCQSAHTVLGRMNGFSDEQMLQLRAGEAPFNPKLDALVKLAGEIVRTKGHPATATVDAFMSAGYTRASLVDLLLAVADKQVMNYLHNITQIAIDFPLAPELEPVAMV